MQQLDEYRPFRIPSWKNIVIFEVRKGVLYSRFKNDHGWLKVPKYIPTYNRIWSDIKKKGVTYISEEELQKLSQEFKNGKELLT
ncbi:hypothetical protein [Streptococcus acidominimus]|uniref:Uncharacterized protein n=1 Tax=Streptococcus acidominimus TaxID=1326 RepID=A0A4Y9FNV7_STRAI|nr:hypothetical protein [Streptococcus acidominimus]MBF0818733.1 hypothetical protein [Streptococcus acidominimus]MBF0838323.1 hypothetical protein [Streptococcus acidominimus]MBF0848958.1 hypothetical protein [Streptococcus danieliae]TFU30895.1 hypothetical protein E4U01_04575 [Streptococcus acidominimus]